MAIMAPRRWLFEACSSGHSGRVGRRRGRRAVGPWHADPEQGVGLLGDSARRLGWRFLRRLDAAGRWRRSADRRRFGRRVTASRRGRTNRPHSLRAGRRFSLGRWLFVRRLVGDRRYLLLLLPLPLHHPASTRPPSVHRRRGCAPLPCPPRPRRSGRVGCPKAPGSRAAASSRGPCEPRAAGRCPGRAAPLARAGRLSRRRRRRPRLQHHRAFPRTQRGLDQAAFVGPDLAVPVPLSVLEVRDRGSGPGSGGFT